VHAYRAMHVMADKVGTASNIAASRM
jgi:hypothetical protein